MTIGVSIPSRRRQNRICEGVLWPRHVTDATTPVSQLWLFWLAPIVGGIVGGFVFGLLGIVGGGLIGSRLPRWSVR